MTDKDTAETLPTGALKEKNFDEVCAILADEQGAQGVVHSKPPDGGRWGRCFSFRPDEYSEDTLLDTIQAEYGPGDYPVQFKTPNENGRPLIRWHHQYTIQQRRLSAQAAATAAPAAGRFDGNSVLAAALENNTRILESLVERLAQQPKAERPPSTIEVAKDLAALKDLFQTEKSSPMESIREVLEVMALLKDNGPGGDDPLSAAIKHLLPAITKGSEQLAARETQRAISAPPTPAASRTIPSAPAQPIVAPPARSNIEDDDTMQTQQAYDYFCKNFLPTALQLANAKRDPREVADYIVRIVGTSPAMVDMIGRVISEDDMVSRLVAVRADVSPYAAWFDAVADWLAHALWPDANDAPDAGSATIDATIEAPGAAPGINAPNGEAKTDQAHDHEAELNGDNAKTAPHGSGPPHDP